LKRHGPRKHQVADATIRKVEGFARRLELADKGLQALGNRRLIDRTQKRCRGFARRAIREADIEKLDELDPTRAEAAREMGGVLAKIRGSEAVAEKPPDLSGRHAVVVAVDREREPDVGTADQLLRENRRTAAT
jgi:hypothetical protein